MTREAPRGAAVLLEDRELLRARLKALPLSPGVYLFSDRAGTVIYVGKAGKLRNRVSSYFSGIDSHTPKTRRLVENAANFEVISCASDEEALLLEAVLIKRHRPRYNVSLRDDKNYLYLRVPRPVEGTGRNADLYPRPGFVRKVGSDGANYFGPYASSRALRDAVGVLRTVVPFRACSDEMFARGRVCLDFHIKRCAGPCEGLITAQDYSLLLSQVETFLTGDTAGVAQALRSAMDAAAERMDYESAARLRDRLHAVESIRERQVVIRGRTRNEDVLGVAFDGERAIGSVLVVRAGRVIGAETYHLQGDANTLAEEWLAGFFDQYYANAQQLPDLVALPCRLPEMDAARTALELRSGHRVELRCARRGVLAGLLARAHETATAALSQRRVEDDFDAERSRELLVGLQRALRLPRLPRRIECYDISNTMGTHSVASMVVFVDARPAARLYRQFSIRSVRGPDDFASMAEAIRRRFSRLGTVARMDGASGTGEQGAEPPTVPPTSSPSRSSQRVDPSFSAFPDLLLIDGGKGQVSAVVKALDEAGISVPVVGLAKRNEELYPAHATRPIILGKDDPVLFLVQRIRDEAHRFAITRHRARREKVATGSRLDQLPGVGPVRKKALIREFGSLEGVRRATVDEIARVAGFSRVSAIRLKEVL